MQEGNGRYKDPMSTKLTYCGQLVKEHDPDRYLLSMLVTPEKREALWALFAFNYEIAKTREIVTEMQLGRIRLQWWRDALEGIYKDGIVPEHQVLEPLAAAIRAYNLPRDLFDILIEAREFDLDNTRPENIEGLLNYCDFTNTPLLKLALLVEGADPQIEPAEVIATNYGLMGVLRAIPFLDAQGRNLLPKDQDDIAVLAGELVRGIKTNSRVLKGAQALSMIYFKQLRHCRFDVYAPRMQMHPPFKELRVLLGVLL